MEKYIFLDFDGVLNINGQQSFYRAQHFAEVVSPLDHVKTVFSTSWREYSTVEKLASYLPKKIQHKCVGMTPFIREHLTHIRYKEIMLYVNQHGIEQENWVALDDLAVLFPKNCDNLILVNPKTGFSRREEKILLDRLLPKQGKSLCKPL